MQRKFELKGLTLQKIADEIGISTSTVATWEQKAGISRRTGAYGVLSLCIVELFKLGIDSTKATRVMGDVRNEVEFLLADNRRKAWLLMYENGRAGHVQITTSATAEHLDAILESHPYIRVIALHHVVARAVLRWNRLTVGEEAIHA